MHAVMFAPLLGAAAEFWSLFRGLSGQRQSTRRAMIPVFAFAFERGFGLDSCASALSELFVNLARPLGPDQPDGPRHVYQWKYRAALPLAVALGSLFAANLTSTAARAEALLLVEADSGKVLRAENATYPWYPASVTKLMTAYVTLRAIKDRRITLETLFTVSRNAMAQSPTKMGFPVGTQVTVDNALKMLMVHSANDMAVLLAEGVSGSIENFADEMTRTAHRLGMSESNFVNPNGLPADGQITSARDLAILARALIRDFPEYESYWHIAAIRFGRRVMRNTNSLIGRYPGIDGMKTGFICASGFNVVATATRDGKRLIAVVLGAPSSAARAVKAAELLESGFTQNPLSWLTPALGQVDALAPIEAAPPNLHEEVCGRHRKHPRAEDEDEEAGNLPDGSPFSAVLSSLRAPVPKGAALLSDFGAATPVVVYTGPTRTLAELATMKSEPVAAMHRRKKGAKIAAKPAEAAATETKTTDGKTTDSKKTDGKTADGKAKGGKSKTGAAPWTPTSASSLSANPPPELGAKSAADAQKKRAKATPPAKPTTTQ
jgi:D-alanyl-D-alanine carboxypeptidase